MYSFTNPYSCCVPGHFTELRIPTGAEFTEGAHSLQNGKRTEVSCCEGSTPEGDFVLLLLGLFWGVGTLQVVQLLESLTPITAGLFTLQRNVPCPSTSKSLTEDSLGQPHRGNPCGTCVSFAFSSRAQPAWFFGHDSMFFGISFLTLERLQ